LEPWIEGWARRGNWDEAQDGFLVESLAIYFEARVCYLGQGPGGTRSPEALQAEESHQKLLDLFLRLVLQDR
jgi:hypothetical protein